MSETMYRTVEEVVRHPIASAAAAAAKRVVEELFSTQPVVEQVVEVEAAAGLVA